MQLLIGCRRNRHFSRGQAALEQSWATALSRRKKSTSWESLSSLGHTGADLFVQKPASCSCCCSRRTDNTRFPVQRMESVSHQLRHSLRGLLHVAQSRPDLNPRGEGHLQIGGNEQLYRHVSDLQKHQWPQVD